MFDSAFAFCRALVSSLGEKSNQVLVSLRGLGDEANYAETSAEEPVYGVIGFISRPMDPDDNGAAEFVAARGDDSLTPIAGRDLRICKARGNVPKGTATMCTHTGAFVSIDNAPSGTGSVVTIYAPYEHTDGVPAKAHAITIDTTTNNEHVAVIHAAGHSILLTKDGALILKNAAGDVFVSIEDGGVTIAGPVQATTNMVIGSAVTAKQIVTDESLGLWFSQAKLAINAMAAYINGLAPGTVVPVAAASPTPSTIAKASIS